MYDFPLTQEFEWIAHVRIIDQAQEIIVSCARFLLWCTAGNTTLGLIWMPRKPSDRKSAGGGITPALCADIGKSQTDERVGDLLAAQGRMNIGVIDVYNFGSGEWKGDLGQ